MSAHDLDCLFVILTLMVGRDTVADILSWFLFAQSEHVSTLVQILQLPIDPEDVSTVEEVQVLP